MFAEMNVQTVISTDLITPLGAYLRLRGGDRAGSGVGRARATWAPLVRRNRLAVRGLRGGRGCAEPSSATSATTTRRRWNPRSSSRTAARPAGKPVRRRRHADPVRPRAWPGGGPARQPGRHRGAAPSAVRRRAAAAGRRANTFPRPVRVRETGRAGEAPHPRGRRIPDRPLPARRAADAGLCRRPLPVTPTRQSVALPLPAGAGRARTRRILAGDAGQGRQRDRRAESDRRHDASG